MAKQLLNKFKFNLILNEALKERFGAKFDGQAKQWYVNSKASALEANELIAKVTYFEADRKPLQNDGYRVFANEHPGFSMPHPLTGEEWTFINVRGWAKNYGADTKQAVEDMKQALASVGLQ